MTFSCWVPLLARPAVLSADPLLDKPAVTHHTSLIYQEINPLFFSRTVMGPVGAHSRALPGGGQKAGLPLPK